MVHCNANYCLYNHDSVAQGAQCIQYTGLKVYRATTPVIFTVRNNAGRTNRDMKTRRSTMYAAGGQGIVPLGSSIPRRLYLCTHGHYGE